MVGKYFDFTWYIIEESPDLLSDVHCWFLATDTEIS